MYPWAKPETPAMRRKFVAKGIDPSAARKAKKSAQVESAVNSF
jgi:hypothetical protein